MTKVSCSKTLLVLTICLLMVLSTVACSTAAPTAAPTAAAATASATAAAATASAAQQATELPTEQPKEAVTQKIWINNFSNPGVQKTPIADKLAEKTGVTLDVVTGDASKFKVLLAGSDLPDIVQFNFTSLQMDANTLISSNQVISLDSLIDQYGNNLKANYPKRLEYSKQFLSNGQNQIYFLPVQAYVVNQNQPNISPAGVSQGYMLRWDIYTKIGFPAINNNDDFLKVLKQMQDADPKTADGKKTYAISGWSDWGIWPWHIATAYSQGYKDYTYDIWFDCINAKATAWYANDQFWDSILFFNKAYQMGILDPEAFTMKYDNYTEKLKTGQVLMCYASWQDQNNAIEAAGQPGVGFEYVPVGMPYVAATYGEDSPVGWGADYPLCITKNCTKPESAIQFIDYIFGYEGSRLLFSGIQDVHWEIKDGKIVPTDAVINGRKSDPQYNDVQGFTLGTLSGFNNGQLAPDGFPVDVGQADNVKANAGLTQVDKDYCAHYGTQYQYPGQVVSDMVKNGKIKTWTKNWVFPQMVGQPSDDTKNKMAQIDQYMQNEIAKIILCKTDADYQAEVKTAKDTLKSMGYDAASAEILALYQKAQDNLKSFNPY